MDTITVKSSTGKVYEVVNQRQLGHGHHGTVYKAIRSNDKKVFAIKFSRMSLRAEYDALKAICAAKNFFLPRVYAFLPTDNESGWTSCLVLELLGPSLGQIFRDEGCIKPAVAGNIGCQMTRALMHIHKCGYIHGDVSTRNIVKRMDGQNLFVLIDFGSAIRYRDKDSVRVSSWAATALYSSPSWHYKMPPSGRDDVISLGYVLLHVVHGSLPWIDYTDSLEVVASKISITEAAFQPSVPSQLIKLVRHAFRTSYTSEPSYNDIVALFRDMRASFHSEADNLGV